MGVKSLWSLLTPVGRPVMLEAVEGQVMAIDSSIWLYQFQATMRDKDGKALVNAHVLGFLRRISKLLFYGIKPVFVFDGGAPVLKKSTITERRRKKAGAAASHAKIAERLLAAQMRREALNHAEESPRNTKANTSVTFDENTVYLEDLDPANKSYTSPLKSRSEKSPNKPRSRIQEDQYQLPDIDLEAAVAKATSGHVPDPRLATEAELRAFIEEMRPEDFDYTSSAFRELPTEVQYEIIGDLRLKSRQTSYKRLETMLRNTKTPMDFSKQQILHLKQRNELTQQLLATTDSIGQAHLTIPVRIASERNKEYMLIKNEGKDGGWILGIRDEGTISKPIEIDQSEHEDDEESDEDDMEEVVIPNPAPADPDLQNHMREMALASIAGRQKAAFKGSFVKTGRRVSATKKSSREDATGVADEEDEELAFAIQASLDYMELQPIAGPSGIRHDDDDDYVVGPSRLYTQLSIANASPKKPSSTDQATPPRSTFGKPFLLTTGKDSSSIFGKLSQGVGASESKDDLPVTAQHTEIQGSSDDDDMEEVLPQYPQSQHSHILPSIQMEEAPTAPPTVHASPPILRTSPPKATPPRPIDLGTSSAKATSRPFGTSTILSAEPRPPMTPKPIIKKSGVANGRKPSLDGALDVTQPPLDLDPEAPMIIDSDEDPVEWSRSPTPILGEPSPSKPTLTQAEEKEEHWDAAQEMDVHAEEGEFARFLSQVKGRDLNAVRKEIDDEIVSLNQQRKNTLRDSEDITQQMISQIMMMLRLFGIPYITAPMEAEAQCAELINLGLVDGVITDDSDVFLFGGSKVYKNMFNQSKTVECFLSSDLTRELGLDRDTLIRLAYLLGSDYVDGLPGVGPVIAMELLKEFPGQDGLHKFKDWWSRVQTGKDKKEESSSEFRKRFKKKFKDLYLQPEWPNPAVRDAYYHPTVDSSDEPFKWGMPDLDGLRSFLYEELGWQQGKVDELLLPVIQKMNKRSQAAALNRQGTLNAFLDINPASGTHAPRKRKAYASRRLQQVVSDYRQEQKRLGARGMSTAPTPEEEEEPVKKKQKKIGGKERKSGKTAARRKKQKESSDDEESVEESHAGPSAAEPVERAQLGLRPRPRLVQRRVVETNDETDSI